MPTYRIDAFTATDRGTVIASFSGCSRKTAWQSEKQSDQAGPRSRRAAISLSYPLGPAPSAREGPAWDRAAREAACVILHKASPAEVPGRAPARARYSEAPGPKTPPRPNPESRGRRGQNTEPRLPRSGKWLTPTMGITLRRG